MKLGNVGRAAVLGTGVIIAMAPFFVDLAREGAIPVPATIEAVAKEVRARFEPGDCVVVRPAWSSEVLSRLTGMGPGTEAWPFPALMASEDLDPVAMGACARIWWADFFGRATGPSPLSPDEVAASEVIPFTDPQVAARATLTRYDLHSLKRFRTLSTELDKAEVFRGPRGSDGVKCRLRGDSHHCGSDSWLDVRLQGRHVGHHEVYWPFVHPGPGEQDLRVLWPDDPTTPRPTSDPAWLIIRAGYSMEGVRHPEGTDVVMTIRIDGELVDSITLPARKWQLIHRVFPVSGGEAWPTVEFRIHADDPGWRELLIDADFTDRIPGAYTSDPR